MYKGRGARLLFNFTLICAGRNDRGPMVSPVSLPAKIRFDSFELDVTSGELRKGGHRLRLQPQPFRVLLLLIERTGQVVAREEIQRCLWKDSTFVDFEHGINFCINQIRGALSDSAEKPRYIETVPRRGYRFIGTVEQPSPTKQDNTKEPTPPPIQAEPLVTPPARKRWPAVVALTLLAAAIAAGAYFFTRRAPVLIGQDTIVLADFANSTGDAIFDDTLKTALHVSLRQSPFLNVLSDSGVTRSLQLMTRPASTKLTPEVARELCQRAGSKAYVSGSIANLGSEYVLGLKAVNCQSGDTLAEEQVTAASKEKVLDALGKAASQLRTELGESLATVKKFDVPLEEATTSSLEALKAYSLGDYQHAIELDPNFAMGYLAVGTKWTLSERGRAAEYITKAFQLREHASEREKLTITGVYYSSVTGELDKAAQTFQEDIKSYPRDGPPYDALGGVYAQQGQYEKAAEITRQSLAVAPGYVFSYSNLANYVLALQRFDEARPIIHEALARNMDDRIAHNALYALAFLGADSTAMAEQQQWFATKPEYENVGLALASDTEAYAGHLRKARERGQAVRRLCDTRRRQGKRGDMAGERCFARSRVRQRCGSPDISGGGLKACSRQSGSRGRSSACVCHGGRHCASRVIGTRLRETVPAEHADAVALAACDSGTIGIGPKEFDTRPECSANCFIDRARADYVRDQQFLPISGVCTRRGLPGSRTGQCCRRRVSEDSRPQRHRLELLDGSVGASGRGTCQCLAGAEPRRERMPTSPALAPSPPTKISLRSGKTRTPTSLSSGKLEPSTRSCSDSGREP